MKNAPTKTDGLTPNIHSNINIDMQELVSVGLSEMESRLYGYIKTLQKAINDLQQDIKIDTKAIDTICISKTPAVITRLKEYLEMAGIDSYNVQVSEAYVLEEKIFLNKYTLSLMPENNAAYRISATTLKTIKTPVTSVQVLLQDKVKKATAAITNHNTKIVKYRRQLSDMSRMERLMKARIVKTQLDKTTNGKELLASFMDKFDQDLKALE